MYPIDKQKDLLESTRKSTEHTVKKTSWGKESGKNGYICVCVIKPLCCTETDTIVNQQYLNIK